MTGTPERRARRDIDANLAAAGWLVQSREELDLTAGRGIAVREFPMKPGFGAADYVLYLDREAAGAIEAKASGAFAGVEEQSAKYAAGLPDDLPARHRPLPFLFESNGSVTYFTNGLDPAPRGRQVFNFPRPETLADLIARPMQLRAKLKELPPLDESRLWSVQARAIRNLEESFAGAHPRALIQMATGSGKTFTAVNVAYRLLKFGGARRILFLVDRSNLGRQTEDEFANFTPPDDPRKFPALYTVQRLAANSINPAANVVVTTIQRLYSMLKGDPEFDAGDEEGSAFDAAPPWRGEPPDVAYNEAVPPEFFDFIVVDECHRSIYDLWSQVLLYFDSFMIGLTATPAGKTVGFFKQNLVMQYGHDEAVVDGVNVDFDVWRIRTEVTERGATVEAGDGGVYVDVRHKLTRAERLRLLSEDLTYTANELDRDVVSESQIRTVLRQFRDKVLPEAFPGRTEAPKTLIFAKDDSHADDIVPHRPRGVRARKRLLPQDHLPHRLHQGREDRHRGRRKRDRDSRMGEDRQPDPGRDTRPVPHRLLPAHRRHGGHDLHRHRREADRMRVLHAQRQIGRLLRADEGPGRPRRLAGQAARGHPRARRSRTASSSSMRWACASGTRPIPGPSTASRRSPSNRSWITSRGAAPTRTR